MTAPFPTSRHRPLRRNAAIVLLGGQLFAAFIAMVAAYIELESILVTGPMLATIGFALAIVTLPLGSWLALLFSLSAPAVCALAPL